MIVILPFEMAVFDPIPYNLRRVDMATGELEVRVSGSSRDG
jgi:hypothetical protein